MVEPLTAVLKEIDGKPVTLLRTASGKTVAAVYDEDYINRFLEAARKSPSTEINKPYRISSLDSDYQDSAYFMDSPTGKRLWLNNYQDHEKRSAFLRELNDLTTLAANPIYLMTPDSVRKMDEEVA